MRLLFSVRPALFVVALLLLSVTVSAQVTATYNGTSTQQLADGSGNPTTPAANLGLSSLVANSIGNDTGCDIIVRVYCYNQNNPAINTLVAEVGISAGKTWNAPPGGLSIDCDGFGLAITYEKVGTPGESIVVL